MITYLDSSALIKFISDEEINNDLQELSRSTLATSIISRAEIAMYLRRKQIVGTIRLSGILPKVLFIPLSNQVVEFTEILDFKVSQRALDAIHLASAFSLGESLAQLVTFDKRMILGAAALGINVNS